MYEKVYPPRGSNSSEKTLITILLLVFCSIAAFAQTKPRLGILPFAGGSESDGEAIASLFSLQRDIMNTFTVVPRTSAVNALLAEQNFQMSGYTDSDTIVHARVATIKFA
jgi:hypothetical protein